jgi:hypothetical protein
VKVRSFHGSIRRRNPQFVTDAKKFDDAWANSDAAFLAVSYTEDAVVIDGSGPHYGRQAINKLYEQIFKMVHFSNHLSTLDQCSPYILNAAGNEIWSNGKWSQSVKGAPVVALYTPTVPGPERTPLDTKSLLPNNASPLTLFSSGIRLALIAAPVVALYTPTSPRAFLGRAQSTAMPTRSLQTARRSGFEFDVKIVLMVLF